ncbi:Peptidyl-prolyl isomerase cwc27 [Haplosporangium sp. Z 11]|nr:Peptidyl-prolyl isomerase cwc27 [Haplosporangium sp. Z 11]
MSNIYLLEPHTNGKVNLHTTYGDISIELWPKEAPKACRNFIQLCMEGYYNDTIFHRIVAGFIIQGGDPEGTGLGGESCFEGGKPFQDEFHSRLRFVRRGLVAMANSGQPNDNKSQFFITLDATMELQNKHTIFGKVAGDTVFNVLKIGSLEVDADERPLYPPKINSCTIVVNPFDDIVPRVSRQELEAARLKELEAQKKPEKQKKLKKNVALLSFADDAPDITMDEDVQDGSGDKVKQAKKKKMLSSHDLLEDDPTLSREVDHSLVADERGSDEPKSKKHKTNDEESLGGDGKETRHHGKDHSKRDDEETSDHESATAFEQRMRDQVREKHKKAKLAQESSSSSASVPATTIAATKDDKSITLAEPETKLSKGDLVRQEIQKLESDIRKMHNRNKDSEEEAKKKNKAPKVSLLQQSREQYKTRAESKGTKRSKSSKSAASAENEREVFEKLSAFEAKLFTMAREPEPNPAPKMNDAPPCEIHGIPSCESCQDMITKRKRKIEKAEGGDEQDADIKDVDEDDMNDSDDDSGWLQHKLVCEKDLKGKEVSLSSKRDDVNDYLVIDPLNKAASTTAALELEKQKKRDKIKRNNLYSQDDRRDRRSNPPSSSSSSRHDRPDDRASRYSSSSSSYRRDDGRKSGYSRDDRNNRESRDSRNGRDSRDNRDSRDRDRDRRW